MFDDAFFEAEGLILVYDVQGYGGLLIQPQPCHLQHHT